MKRQIRPLLIIIVLLALLVFSGCNMSLSKTETLPATITIQPELPEVTMLVTIEPEVIESPTVMPIVEVTAEAVEEKEVPTATLEPTATEQEVEVKEAVTVTPEAVATEEVVVETEETPTVEATPIPANANANPDATVFFYQSVGCYREADLTSYNYGAVSAGTAGAAFARIGNFYQVSHPNQARIICWVTGDGVSPNLPAFNLSQ
ncbi:MAG: hypothetical protein K8R40_09950 [Anaerolineaceae bacterium]|nr:hypothetical protein [Anaerolineaceae bacterium]